MSITFPSSNLTIQIDTASYFPKTIEHNFLHEKLPFVAHAFTMGCMKKGCDLPDVMNITNDDIIDWNLDDPAKDDVDVLQVRDKIIENCLGLIEELKKNH